MKYHLEVLLERIEHIKRERIATISCNKFDAELFFKNVCERVIENDGIFSPHSSKILELKLYQDGCSDIFKMPVLSHSFLTNESNDRITTNSLAIKEMGRKYTPEELQTKYMENFRSIKRQNSMKKIYTVLLSGSKRWIPSQFCWHGMVSEFLNVISPKRFYKVLDRDGNLLYSRVSEQIFSDICS